MSAQENYEKLLSAQHGRVIDFVKYAEAKNAALLTFCSIWIGTTISMLRDRATLPAGYAAAFQAILPLLSLAALVALSSFLPRRLRDYFQPSDLDDKNLLYFEDVAQLKHEAYASRLKESYFPAGNGLYRDKYIDDLIIQIWVQSGIANAKFERFKWAALIVLVAFGVVAAPSLWWLAERVIAVYAA